jgi:hypothetical protein
MYPYKLDHIFSYAAGLNPEFEVIGPTPEGLRVNLYITGGEVTGPKLQGQFLPVGADWLTIRPDGVAILDVRATIKTHDDALIYMSYPGVGDLGQDGYQRFLDGDPVTQFPIHTTPHFITSHESYLWINRLQCIGIGDADLAGPTAAYDIYGLASQGVAC